MTRAATVLIVLLLAGCSGGSSPDDAAPTAPATTSATLSPTPDRPATAREIVRALKRAVPAVDGVLIYNARTDPNHLLGRPSGYTGKGAWSDTRIPASETVGFTLGDVDVGGGLEVFASKPEAIERGGRLQAIGPPLVKEYDYACGPVLLRVSSYLTPRQAQGYQRAVGRVLGVGCSAVT